MLLLPRRRRFYVEPGPVVRVLAVVLTLASMAATVAATALLMALLNRYIGP